MSLSSNLTNQEVLNAAYLEQNDLTTPAIQIELAKRFQAALDEGTANEWPLEVLGDHNIDKATDLDDWLTLAQNTKDLFDEHALSDTDDMQTALESLAEFKELLTDYGVDGIGGLKDILEAHGATATI